jgi:hypothetical protein
VAVTVGVTSEALAGLLSVERLSLARAAVGVSMITRPAMSPGLLGIDSATAARMAWNTQMLGGREVALGLGTWAALRRDARSGGSGARLWVMAGLLSDAVDALAIGAAVVRGRVSKPRGGVAVAAAGGAVYAQLEALLGADRGP